MSSTISQKYLTTGRLPRVVILAVLAGLVLMLGSLLSQGTAHAAAQDHTPATWNMQGGTDRWAGVYTIAQFHSVVALQEVPGQRDHTPTPPAAAQPTGRHNGNVTEYRWQEGRRGPVRYLYILQTTSRNLGMVTSFRADDFFATPGVYRPLLSVQNNADSVLFSSAHASADGGSDATSLMRRGRQAALDRGLQNWVVLGDFNRDLLRLRRDNQNLPLPTGGYLYDPGQATQRSGGELDYMVSNIHTYNWQATVGRNRGSDHWPVLFGSLRAAAGFVNLSSDSNGGLMEAERSRTANGTPVEFSHANGSDNQVWKLIFTGQFSGVPLYHLVNKASGKCLDIHNGPNTKVGDYLVIWDCHNTTGEPDTQNFTLQQGGQDPAEPDRTIVQHSVSNYFLNVLGDRRGDDARVGLWPIQPYPNRNESFYIHPAIN
jgi:hypothetical protein